LRSLLEKGPKEKHGRRLEHKEEICFLVRLPQLGPRQGGEGDG
jgi:hypothetical protein